MRQKRHGVQVCDRGRGVTSCICRVQSSARHYPSPGRFVAGGMPLGVVRAVEWDGAAGLQSLGQLLGSALGKLNGSLPQAVCHSRRHGHNTSCRPFALFAYFAQPLSRAVVQHRRPGLAVVLGSVVHPVTARRQQGGCMVAGTSTFSPSIVAGSRHRTIRPDIIKVPPMPSPSVIPGRFG